MLDDNFQRLPKYPLEAVPQSIVGNIQKCWAEKPYGGPQYSLAMTDARIVSASRYYLVFEPHGIADVLLVFLVDRKTGVVEAYQYGMV